MSIQKKRAGGYLVRWVDEDGRHRGRTVKTRAEAVKLERRMMDAADAPEPEPYAPLGALPPGLDPASLEAALAYELGGVPEEWWNPAKAAKRLGITEDELRERAGMGPDERTVPARAYGIGPEAG